MNIGKITKHVKLHILQFKKAIISDSKFKDQILAPKSLATDGINS